MEVKVGQRYKFHQDHYEKIYTVEAVVGSDGGFIVKWVWDDNDTSIKYDSMDYFKSICTLYEEEKEDVVKLYTNSEIMDLMEQGYFVEGDKITNEHHLTINVACNCSGNVGFDSIGQNHVVFKQGDRWTITLVDRWEEVDVKEAMYQLSLGEDIKHECDDEVGYFSYVDALKIVFTPYQICNGTWYKKVKRNEV